MTTEGTATTELLPIKDGLLTRMELNRSGEFTEHHFGVTCGHDVWGYDPAGRYDRTYDRAPFQRSPFFTEHDENRPAGGVS